MGRRSIIAANLLAIALASLPAFAADDVVVDPGPALAPRARNVIVQPMTFDQMVLGMDEATFQKRIETQITQKLREMEKRFDLSDEARRKLELAARADKVRLYADIDALRRKFDSVSGNTNTLKTFPRDVSAIRSRQSSLLGTGSFFAKASKKILADTSTTVSDRNFADLQANSRHRANIEVAVRAVERHVPLRKPQHEMLAKQLFKETRPDSSVREFDDLVLKYRLARLPDDKLKPMFDKGQWLEVRAALDKFLELGPVLLRHGVIEPDSKPERKPVVGPPAVNGLAGVANVPVRPAGAAAEWEQRRPAGESPRLSHERRLLLSRHRANLDAAARMVGRRVDLRQSQSEALVDVLFRELPVPTVFGDYDDLVVQYGFSQITDDKLKPLFDHDQWPQIRKAIGDAEQLKLLLVSKGMINQTIAAAPVLSTEYAIQGVELSDPPADATQPVNAGKELK